MNIRNIKSSVNRLSKRQKSLVIIAIIILIVIGTIKINFLRNQTLTQSPTNPDLKITEDIPQPLEKFNDYGILIDKIKVSAPIIPQVDGFNEKIYYSALKNGVGQFKNSTNPDVAGNLFIFGHSSSKQAGDSKYKEIFKELDQLAESDIFSVYYKEKEYRYKVTKSYVTNDKDWEILDPTPKDKDDKTITLMTCWPPGTIEKRWVVIGTQI